MFYVDQLGGTRKLRDVSKRLEVDLEAKPDVMFVSLVGLGFRKRFSSGFLRSSVHHFFYTALL